MSSYHEKQKLPLLRDEGEGEGEGGFDYSQRVHIHGGDETEGEEFTGTPSFSWLFTGPGLLMSIAFLDPGKLEAGRIAVRRHCGVRRFTPHP
nr:metal transporter Nramp3-like [Ipomoea trifida]